MPDMGLIHKQILEWKNEYIETLVALYLDDVQCDLTTMQTREERAAQLANLVGEAIADTWNEEVMARVKTIGVYASGIPYEAVK